MTKISSNTTMILYGLGFILLYSHFLLCYGYNNKLVILGLGRLGSEVARCAVQSGYFDRIMGTSRAPWKIANDDSIGGVDLISFSQWDSLEPYLKDCNYMLTTIPPFDGCEDVYRKIVANLPKRSWIGMISTTGVYGDHDGGWVDESSSCLCSPNSKAGQFLQLEGVWQEIAEQHNLHGRVFRCAGIYGNTRSALHTIYKNGLSIDPLQSLGKDITNRIHEADIARAVLASMQQKDATDVAFRLYNLSDDLPESRCTVMEYAKSIFCTEGVVIKAKENEQQIQITSDRTFRRGSERKKVCNTRMKQELLSGRNLLYGTYIEGLESILRYPKAPWNMDP